MICILKKMYVLKKDIHIFFLYGKSNLRSANSTRYHAKFPTGILRIFYIIPKIILRIQQQSMLLCNKVKRSKENQAFKAVFRCQA